MEDFFPFKLPTSTCNRGEAPFTSLLICVVMAGVAFSVASSNADGWNAIFIGGLLLTGARDAFFGGSRAYRPSLAEVTLAAFAIFANGVAQITPSGGVASLAMLGHSVLTVTGLLLQDGDRSYVTWVSVSSWAGGASAALNASTIVQRVAFSYCDLLVVLNIGVTLPFHGVQFCVPPPHARLHEPEVGNFCSSIGVVTFQRSYHHCQ